MTPKVLAVEQATCPMPVIYPASLGFSFEILKNQNELKVDQNLQEQSHLRHNYIVVMQVYISPLSSCLTEAKEILFRGK